MQLQIAPDIRAALDQGEPVVALESTLITHGLPYPLNLETALAMEAAVREGGALPATIAILQGEITVGLSQAQIESRSTSCTMANTRPSRTGPAG